MFAAFRNVGDDRERTSSARQRNCNSPCVPSSLAVYRGVDGKPFFGRVDKYRVTARVLIPYYNPFLKPIPALIARQGFSGRADGIPDLQRRKFCSWKDTDCCDSEGHFGSNGLQKLFVLFHFHDSNMFPDGIPLATRQSQNQ